MAKGNHRRYCNQEPRCRTQEGYVPTNRLIKNPNAAEALLKAIMSTSIYKHAEDFAKVCASKAHCSEKTISILIFVIFHFILFLFVCLFVCMLFQCRDTYFIESLHNCLLIYVPKRIHFSDKVYNMREHLACLDWVSIHNSDSMCLLSNKEIY